MSGHITSRDEYDGHPETRIENASHGGYRAGFEDGQASASKTIAKSLASIIALREIVDQCRAANFIDAAGNVRKVLGTLPVTADGCVIGDGCKVIFGKVEVNSEPFRSPLSGERGWRPYLVRKCFSTREAAEAARKAAEVKP